ncbi:MAG: HEPN domain-containing protein [Patescibacteria group bacterium]
MTQQEAVQHWREGSRGSLIMAKAGLHEKEYLLALFHCHLAVEKALKAEWIAEHDAPDVPHTHDLNYLADQLHGRFTEEQKKLFSDLNDFAVTARYSDPPWAQTQATPERTALWIEKTGSFLTSFLPS